jgi:hypothetical protein
MSTGYKINKGINRPLEFKGLKAQYVTYLAAGAVGLLLVFAIMHLAGVPSYGCVGLTTLLGAWIFWFVGRLSKRWGQHGLMKWRAAQRLPETIRSKSRIIFFNGQ